MSSGRRTTARLLVTPEAATAVDASLVEAITRSRRQVTKTDFADALIRVGLTHMDEVAALLNPDLGDES